MNKKYIFSVLFWMSISSMPLMGQLPKTDFASRGAVLDDFCTRLQTKITYSFSESAKHFMLIWKSAGEKGERFVREKASSLSASGEKKVKEIWKSTSNAVGDSLEEGKDSVKDSLERGKDAVSSAVEEKKFP